MSKLTTHGEKRLRKRLGLSKSGLEKSFGDALLNGRKHNEFKGRFKKYLDSKAAVHKSAPIVYGQNIYWVDNTGTLITVYQVPASLRKYL
jgi:hypothetical protein